MTDIFDKMKVDEELPPTLPPSPPLQPSPEPLPPPLPVEFQEVVEGPGPVQ